MNKYVKFDKTNPIDVNGKLNYEFALNTPAAIRTLIMVYQQGIDVIVKEQGLETVLKKIKDYSDTIKNGSSGSLGYNNENELDIYRVTNIHEFIAGIFIKDSNFAKKMGETQYLNSDKSILEKFVELLGRVFDSILPGAKKDSISTQTLQSLVEFLQGESGIKTEIKPYYESTYNNETNNKVMNEAQNLLNESSNVSENTSVADITMYFNYGKNKRNDVKSNSTFEAILNGERTSTLRKPEWYKNNKGQYNKLANLKPGNVITIWESDKVGQGRKVEVEITRIYKFGNETLNDEQMERLSKMEGWSVEYLKNKGYQNPNGVINIQYKLIDNVNETNISNENLPSLEQKISKNKC